MQEPREQLGYEISQDTNPAGQTLHRLEVNVVGEPTLKHYDPEELELTVADPRGGVQELHIRHSTSREGEYRACAGRVDLCDRRGKCVVFFTYGGQFQVESSPADTTCILTSPAPLPEVIEEDNMWTLLADESEVLLAQRRAAWGRDRDAYHERLCRAEPLVLYAAVLKELHERFEHIPYTLQSRQAQEFTAFLHREMRRHQREPDWPANPPRLDEIL